MADRVFDEPWQAQAFAMATLLQQQGLVSPREWMDALAEEVGAAGETDSGEQYYDHVLAALERVVARKGLIADAELARRKAEWDAAARATPHGQPIELR